MLGPRRRPKKANDGERVLDRRVPPRRWTRLALLAAGLLGSLPWLLIGLWLMHILRPGDTSRQAMGGPTGASAARLDALEEPSRRGEKDSTAGKVEPGKVPNPPKGERKGPDRQGDEQRPPPGPGPKPSLDLFAVDEVRIDAGGRQTLPVEVRRQHVAGPVQIEVAGLPPRVTAGPVTLGDGEDRGRLELSAEKAAFEGATRVTVRARAGEAVQTREVTLTVRWPPRLQLLPLAAVTVEAGHSQSVAVRVERRNCPGPIQLLVAEPPAGVAIKPKMIPADEVRAELEVAAEATAGPLENGQVHLEALGGDAKDKGSFALTVRRPGDPREFINSISMRFVLIPGGTFTMGSPENEEGRSGDEHAHAVEITRPFHLGRCEVTHGQFLRFVEATGYKTEAEKDGRGGWGYNEATKRFEGRKPQYTWRSPGFEQTDEHPVVNVSWNDARAFCDWLSEIERKNYRLPTEAEWEYSCRAHTTTRFHGGSADTLLQRVGNCADASLKRLLDPGYSKSWSFGSWDDRFPFTAPVGRFEANAFGLNDMDGNVWEWCQDWYGADYYKNSPTRDPQGPTAGSSRVIRGGSFSFGPRYSRAACRGVLGPADRHANLGFRVLLVR